MRIAIVALVLASILRLEYMSVQDAVSDYRQANVRWHLYTCLGTDQREECGRLLKRETWL